MSTRQFRILTILTVLAGFLGGGVTVLLLQGERAHAQTDTYEIYALRTAIRDLKSDIEDLKRNIYGPLGTPTLGIGGLKGDIDDLKRNIEDLKRNIYGPLGTPTLGTGGLKGDIDDLKSDVEGLKSATEWDIEGLKSDVEGLKRDVDDLRTAVLVLYRSVPTRGASARTSRRSSAKGYRAGVSHGKHRKR